VTDNPEAFVHPLARVEDDVVIGHGSRVWAGAHLRHGARIGAECVIGSGVTVDLGVIVGDRCKVQNDALLYSGLRIGDGVFIGPGAIFTNDRVPRAVSPTGDLLRSVDWQVTPTSVEDGASVGANATVVAGVRIGSWAMIGAGTVVTHDVPPHALVVGVPGQQVGWVCACGARVPAEPTVTCAACGTRFALETLADRAQAAAAPSSRSLS
jgi:UDP-2-acetamido-3-amino-2,3-dideoxy-glucuronate N-acetyltransferase